MLQITTKIDNRFQMAIGLVLFFPVILESMVKTPSGNVGPDQIILKWGLVIAVLIADYVFVEIVKEKPSFKSILRFTGHLLLIEIALFAPILYILASLQFGNASAMSLGVFAVSTWSIILIPTVILFLLFGNAIYAAWDFRKK